MNNNALQEAAEMITTKAAQYSDNSAESIAYETGAKSAWARDYWRQYYQQQQVSPAMSDTQIAELAKDFARTNYARAAEQTEEDAEYIQAVSESSIINFIMGNWYSASPKKEKSNLTKQVSPVWVKVEKGNHEPDRL